MKVLCHVALERGTLSTWVEAKCHSTLMHEHGSGKVRGMENTWPSNGHVSNRFGGGIHKKKKKKGMCVTPGNWGVTFGAHIVAEILIITSSVLIAWHDMLV